MKNRNGGDRPDQRGGAIRFFRAAEQHGGGVGAGGVNTRFDRS